VIRWTPVALFGAALLALAEGAGAQPAPNPLQQRLQQLQRQLRAQEQSSLSRPALSRPASLKGRRGIELGKRLLGSSREQDRLRGVRRLGSVGTPQALQALVEWLDTPLGSQQGSRLVAVRSLAPHTRIPLVRQALVRIMAVGAGQSQGTDGLGEEVRRSAALALAASRDPDALAALAKALRREGPTAQAAAVALEAHPPRDLGPLVHARGTPTRSLVRLLSRLGDQRAFHPLRSFVLWGTPEIRTEAAVVLTELGALETVPLARHWLEHERESPLARLAAARILALAHTADATEEIERLLQADDTREAGLDLALLAPHPKLVAPLEKLLAGADAATCSRVLGAIGRCGGENAAKVLAAQLTQPGRAAAAGYALALTPHRAASDRLEAALRSAATRRLAARAAVIRELGLGESVAGVEPALESLLASGQPADRAAGAWGLAARDPKRVREFLASAHPEVVAAVASLATTRESARWAARRLLKEPAGSTRTALCIALVHETAADLVPTRLLIELVETGAASAPLAARALAARDSVDLRPRIEALFENADALMRIHVALGLGSSQSPDVVGLLDRGYRLDADADVRHAVVVALSHRTERTRLRTLRLAARLDGDAKVREAARLALRGQRLVELPAGVGTFWLTVSSSAPRTAASAAQPQAALLQTATGLALPLVAAPDGAMVVAHLPPGLVRLRLATPAQSSQAAPKSDRARGAP